MITPEIFISLIYPHSLVVTGKISRRWNEFPLYWFMNQRAEVKKDVSYKRSSDTATRSILILF